MSKSIEELTQDLKHPDIPEEIRAVIRDAIQIRALEVERLLWLAWEAVCEAGYEDRSNDLRNSIERL